MVGIGCHGTLGFGKYQIYIFRSEASHSSTQAAHKDLKGVHWISVRARTLFVESEIFVDISELGLNETSHHERAAN